MKGSMESYYKEEAKEAREKLYKYAEMVGGMKSILTFEISNRKKTDKERVKEAIEYMTKFCKEQGYEF